MTEKEQRVAVSNRKARHDYFILDTVEAGLVLTGTEVKSLRNGNANLLDSHAVIKNGEVWLFGMHISPYDQGSYLNHDPRRTRKLLLSKREIRRLLTRVQEKGLTLGPAVDLFQGSLRKGRVGNRTGKEKLRQARGDQATRRQA